MDFLESYVNENALTMENIRKVIDDYSLISHYIGQELELNTRYSSPLRERDEDPSFSMFFGYGNSDSSKLYFKDQAMNISGDVFDFLKQLMNADSMTKVLKQINFDLGLGLDGEEDTGMVATVLKTTPLSKERPAIEIVKEMPSDDYMNYWWEKYEITRKYTEFYHTSCVGAIHYVYSDKTKIISPQGLCIGYTIGGYHKTYQPFAEKRLKFRNNFPANYVEGHLQLDWSRNDLLVITKAMKECILFRKHWDIQAVSGKSETTMIPSHIMQMYLSHFKRIVIWLDQDTAGLESTQKYLSLYPTLEVAIVPQEVKEKDPTDMFEAKRYQQTTLLIKHVLKI